MKKSDKEKIECGTILQGYPNEEIHIIHVPAFEKGDIVQHRASKQQAVIVQYKLGDKYEITTGFDEIFLCSEIVLEKVEPHLKDVTFTVNCPHCNQLHDYEDSGFDVQCNNIDCLKSFPVCKHE